ncbi:RES domain-containing protein [Legionella busanensis]|uniref:RES domain-containing protein n=1 Tax=Legionella busanensis TaxID=190655 RepID=A0A378JMG2_9GAMM|nr:RES family NAD+ phosphorylase [Legionella busanensis]STX51493.1 RES domain-containing protein [Legionella busanensis]
MSLFAVIVDYSEDVFRNIRSVKPSQNLFDDLSEDADNWEAANTLEAITHLPLENSQLIQRGFEYSENSFIDYPFENLTASRFSDGQNPCWYASETLETTIYETVYHFKKEITDSPEAFNGEKQIPVDRRIAKIACIGITIDLSSKTEEYPWLLDPINYSRCQEVGKRVAKEGHPLLRVRSARHLEGINIVAFKSNVLSNVREHCFLKYTLNLDNMEVTVTRGEAPVLII